MSVQADEYLDAINHVPPGGLLRLDNVSWQEYERLLADLGDDSKVRVSYDQGRLEIMAPLPIHEKQKGLVHDFVIIMCEELGLDVEPLGSTTLKRELRAHGAEPDDCFYINNASKISGKRIIDLEQDPPPDLVVEIDSTNESLGKFPIYAALGVSEIWRYDGSRMYVYSLEGLQYVETPVSAAFPNLTTETLTEFIDMGSSQSQSAARRAFREWARRHR